jgi:hypothetical protein
MCSVVCVQAAARQQGLQITSVQLQAATAIVPTFTGGGGGGGMSTSAIVGLTAVAFFGVLLAAGAYYVCVHRQCLSHARRVAAAADAAQPGSLGSAGAAVRVKPFYEAPQFKQTYARQPSLVQQRPPPAQAPVRMQKPALEHARPHPQR